MNAQYNVIAVLDEGCEHVLMCRRSKPPYQGLFNLVGGKIEYGEDGVCAAYRELWEETGIAKEDIGLVHLMDFTYHLSDVRLEVYAGRLRSEVGVHGEENELEWIAVGHDFFDTARFAGEGNIGHIMEHIRLSRDMLPR